MNAHRSFGLLVAVACLAGLLLSTALVGPLIAGSIAHQAEMPMSGGLWDVIVACLSQPYMVPWPVLLLVYVPALLVVSALLTGAWMLAGQWLATRRAVYRLQSLPTRASHSPKRLSLELLQKLSLQDQVDIIYESQPFAFCYGWLSPRICISTGTLDALTEHELEAVLLHERYHMLRHDPLKTTLCLVLSRLFFLLPLVRALQEQYLVSREIEADRHVLAHQSTGKPLLGALYKLLVHCPTTPAPSMTVAGYADCINQRLDYLLSGNPPHAVNSRALWHTLLVIALIILLGGLGTFNSAASALWSDIYCTISACPLMH